MNATVYIATSLDGFIARENGELDWLHEGGASSDGEDYGYKAFMQTVDAIVMGRHTYEKVRTFNKWPYDKPVIVLASRPLAIPPELQGAVEHMSGQPAEILARLSARGMHHVYVDGGRTIQKFLEARAIQRLIITRIPVLIGRGISLFGPVSCDIHLQHIATRQYPNGLVQSEYAVTV
jgi:dihydrofolate reductase